jgi:hypothetical protein
MVWHQAGGRGGREGRTESGRQEAEKAEGAKKRGRKKATAQAGGAEASEGAKNRELTELATLLYCYSKWLVNRQSVSSKRRRKCSRRWRIRGAC